MTKVLERRRWILQYHLPRWIALILSREVTEFNWLERTRARGWLISEADCTLSDEIRAQPAMIDVHHQLRQPNGSLQL